MKVFDNINDIVRDDLEESIAKGSKVSIAAASFSMYAYEELKESLKDVDEFRFLFTSPAFTEDSPKRQRREFYIPQLDRENSLYGTEFEIKLRNELTQRAIARECAEWVKSKATFKANVAGENMAGFMTVDTDGEQTAYMPMERFTTVDIGCDRYKKRQIAMDRFFRAYLTMRTGKIPRKDKVYATFKRYAADEEFDANHKWRLAQDLLSCAEHFTNFVYCRTGERDLGELYEDISDLKMEPADALLLRFHIDHANNVINDDEFLYLLRLLTSYILRRSVCGVPANGLNKAVVSTLVSIKENDYVNSVSASLVLRDGTQRFPTDDELKRSFRSRDMYTAPYLKYILRRLEQYDNKTPVQIEKYTIEHVLPQNQSLPGEWKDELGPNWREEHEALKHTIGNLTLTSYNSEMCDAPFQKKLSMKGGLRETGLRLNSDFINTVHWNGDAIRSRGKRLATTAVSIWPYPVISDAELAPYLSKARTYDFDFYNPSITARQLFHTLDSAVMNISEDVKREFKKLYAAYKHNDKNFLTVKALDKQLKAWMNIDPAEVDDPYGLVHDVSRVGHHGTGDSSFTFGVISRLDQVLPLVRQSYERQDG